jgi:hypothetical protein
LAHLAGEPVDAVDEQQVDPAVAGEIERRFQAGPVEPGAGRPVLLMGDDVPTFLRLAERLQPLALRVQGGGLVTVCAPSLTPGVSGVTA